MRLSRFAPVLPALLLVLSTVQADDTKDFLDPANWQGRTDIWKIDGDKVTGHTKEDPKYNTFFASKKEYSDFEISFKVRLKDGVGNSGLQVRSALKDDKKFTVAGPQIDVGKGYWGSLYGEGIGGMFKASDPKLIESKVKPMEFNEFHAVVKGDHYTIKVNGETFIDADFPKTPGKDPKDAPKKGIIAFQAHAGYPTMTVEFTDIKFKDLSAK